LRRTRTISLADIVEIKYTTLQVGASVQADTASKSYTISSTLPQVDEAKWLATVVSRAVARHKGEPAAAAGCAD
jgi:hypothetical protein